LAETLRNKLTSIEGVKVTDEGFEKCGIVTFTATQLSPSEIKQKLRERKINVSTSKGSGNLVSFQQRGLTEVVRASVHYYNTEQEIDHFIETLQYLLR
jgi:selenocysteine lyase/cysteine desulfurase